MLLVLERLFRRCNGRAGVGHDEAATKARTSVLQNVCRLDALSHVVMKVIGRDDRDAGAWCGFVRAHGGIFRVERERERE